MLVITVSTEKEIVTIYFDFKPQIVINESINDIIDNSFQKVF